LKCRPCHSISSTQAYRLELGGWWAEACRCDVGGSISEGKEHNLYAESVDGENAPVTECHCKEQIAGAIHGYSYQANIDTTRPVTDFTARVIPHHTEAQIPAEAGLITWQR